MIVKTYDPVSLEEKETVSKIKSVIFNRSFYEVGTFEIKTTSTQFCTNDIIAFVGFGKIRSGIVMKITDKDNEITVSGYDLKGIMNFRYITEETAHSGNPFTIATNILRQYLLTGDRQVENLSFDYDFLTLDNVDHTFTTGTLSSQISEFLQTYEIGCLIEFDLTSLKLKLLKGTDRTENIRFGRKYHNIDSVEYVQDVTSEKNVCYYKNDDGEITQYSTAKGILRREGYQDKNPEEYLNKNAKTQTLRASANDRYAYGVDYDLGDYVTVINRDLTAIKQITQVKEVYEKSGSFVVPIFGTEKENPIKKLIMNN